MDSSTPDKAKRYRMRAEEIRTAAESLHLLSARESMLRIANAYDLLADQAERAERPSETLIG